MGSVKWEEPCAVAMQGDDEAEQEGEPLLQNEMPAEAAEVPWQPRMILRWKPEQAAYRAANRTQDAPSGSQELCAAVSQPQLFARPPIPFSAGASALMQTHLPPAQTWMTTHHHPAATRIYG